jgi:hypothetical protein
MKEYQEWWDEESSEFVSDVDEDKRCWSCDK